MNCNELMIGDWYLASNQHSSPAGDYTLEFYPKVFTLDDLLFAKNNSWDAHDWDEFTRPIPLTQEILEANGFVKRKEKYTPNWNIYILNGNFFLEDRLDDCFHFNGNKIFRIKFVHELQHALRLCGLNDLADNFKVKGVKK